MTDQPPTLPTSMRAGRILGPGHTVVVDLPVPTPGPGDVLIEVARAGICGTDLPILDGDYDLARFPMTPGHEFAGVPSVLEGAVEHARPGGTVWVFGVAPGEAMARISPYALFRRDLALMGTFAVNQTVPQAVALIQGGAVDVESLVSHVLPIDAFAEGLRLAAHDPTRMKIQFSFADASS